MGILEQQLNISNKAVSNDIATDPEARSLTMRNGYYVDSKYPDNRSTMTGENPFSDTDSITISKTAGQIG
jgi:hypothetical protein|tara:strand:+ start:183 stop:392 length:210 start_codon:yes stop_codon:yes gene_type:complete